MNHREGEQEGRRGPVIGVVPRVIGVGAFAIAVLGAGWSGAGNPAPGTPAQPLIMERSYRVELRNVAAVEGEEGAEPSVELTCVARTALPEGAGTYVNRLLCTEGSKPRLAYFHRMDPEAKFPLEDILVDIADRSWIRIREELPKSARIGENESTVEWMKRLALDEFVRPDVRIDTDMLRFDSIPEKKGEELESFAARVRRDIEDRQPELAAFLEWSASWLGHEGSKQMAGARYVWWVLSRLAGFAPGDVPIEVEVTKLDEQLARGKLREPLDPDLETAFGKWASWPDPPRLDD